MTASLVSFLLGSISPPSTSGIAMDDILSTEPATAYQTPASAISLVNTVDDQLLIKSSVIRIHLRHPLPEHWPPWDGLFLDHPFESP
jgi:hypothetical protein